MARKKVYYKRVIIAFDREMFEWLKHVSATSNLTYSEVIERALSLVRFGI